MNHFIHIYKGLRCHKRHSYTFIAMHSGAMPAPSHRMAGRKEGKQ